MSGARHTLTAGQTRAELRDAGRRLRKDTPRGAHADWTPRPDRDPVALLQAQDAARVPELVPVRYARMAASPFAFFRGAAAVMAADLAATPSTGVVVQACGDAHLLNFGTFASPERRLVFDLNDFDETHPGPWEWDVKRLAASFVVAAREVGLPGDEAAAAARAVGRMYADTTSELAQLSPLEIFNQRLEVDDVARTAVDPRNARRVRRLGREARRRTSAQAFHKLARVETEGGGARIVEDPPRIVRASEDQSARLTDFMERYAASLPAHRAHVLRQYRILDAARKVVGVGSVGLRAYVILLVADADEDPLVLQVKEAVPSVLGGGASAGGAAQGRRVVEGQQLMQAFGDPFLGWVSSPMGDFYVRQFRDMKGSVEPEPDPSWFTGYARLCGATLARAHARSLDPALIAGYLGAGDRFSEALAQFAVAYADRSERDWEELRAAIATGRVVAEEAVAATPA